MTKDKKTKLLIVTDYFFPHWTGIAKSISYLIQGIGDQIDTTVLTVRHESSLPQKDKYMTANIIRANYLFPISRSKYSIQIIISFLKIVRK